MSLVVNDIITTSAPPRIIPKARIYQGIPLLLAILIWLLLESLIVLSPLQAHLDKMMINPIPVKLVQLESAAPKQLDFLMLGTSRTWNGLNTAAFEKDSPIPIHAFNMGIPQTGYDWMEIYLKEHVRKYGKPKVLLLEATDFLFNRNYVTNGLYYQNLISRNPRLIADVLSYPLFSQSNKEEILLSLTSVFHRYRQALSPFTLAKTILKTGKTADDFSDMDHMRKGWEPLSKSQVQMPQDRIWVQEKDYLPVDTREFRSLVSYCAKIHLPVILVEWPDEIRYKRICQHSALASAYKQTVSRLVNEYHLPYIDLTRQPGAETPGNFIDMRHLNPQSATQFTKILSDKIFALSEIQGVLKPQVQLALKS